MALEMAWPVAVPATRFNGMRSKYPLETSGLSDDDIERSLYRLHEVRSEVLFREIERRGFKLKIEMSA